VGLTVDNHRDVDNKRKGSDDVGEWRGRPPVSAVVLPRVLTRKNSARRVGAENYSCVRPLMRSEPAMRMNTPRMRQDDTAGIQLGRVATNRNVDDW
jgi:hypothetical protein